MVNPIMPAPSSGLDPLTTTTTTTKKTEFTSTKTTDIDGSCTFTTSSTNNYEINNQRRTKTLMLMMLFEGVTTAPSTSSKSSVTSAAAAAAAPTTNEEEEEEEETPNDKHPPSSSSSSSKKGPNGHPLGRKVGEKVVRQGGGGRHNDFNIPTGSRHRSQNLSSASKSSISSQFLFTVLVVLNVHLFGIHLIGNEHVGVGVQAVALPPFNPFFVNWYHGDGETAASLSSSGVEDGGGVDDDVEDEDEAYYSILNFPPPPQTPPNSDNPFLTPHDFQNAQRSPVVVPTPEEMTAMMVPTLFEGDIVGITFDRSSAALRDAADTDIFSYPHNSALNLGTYPDKLWPGGRVPYQLEKGLEEHQRVAIAQAFQEYREKTCIEFVPRLDDDYDYIFIKRNQHLGCSSYVGRAGGNQTISLEVGKCFTKGIVAHELMHSLGFFHEHSRTDRDKFVKIDENNVKPGMLRNFEKYPRKIIDTLDMPYDYGSVMHYHKLAFSKNGKSTIVPVDPGAEIGQRYRLSEIDAAKVNKLYGCRGQPSEEEENEEITTTSSIKITTTTTTTPETTTTTPWFTRSTTTRPRRFTTRRNRWETTTTTTAPSPSGKSSTTTTFTTLRPSSTTSRTASSSTTSETLTTTTKKQDPNKKPYIKKEKCRDLNEHCMMWSEIGHCKWSEKYMSHYCRKSCQICRPPKGEEEERTNRGKGTSRKTGKGKQGNNNNHGKGGHGGTGAGGNGKRGSKSTDKKGSNRKKGGKGTGAAESKKGGKKTCLDQNLFCGYWARIGECKSESKFMKIFCKQSCKLC